MLELVLGSIGECPKFPSEYPSENNMHKWRVRWINGPVHHLVIEEPALAGLKHVAIAATDYQLVAVSLL